MALQISLTRPLRSPISPSETDVQSGVEGVFDLGYRWLYHVLIRICLLNRL